MIQKTKYKILAIIGPTSSGKSELAVQLAKRFNGEVVSCDSRQIYRGMNLGTGKVTGKWQALPFASHPERVHPNEGSLKPIFVYKSIPHHCIDYINPARQYSITRFQKDAQKAIADILSRGKLPILCGGTMHWVDAVVYNQNIPEVKPNPRLRARLEKLSTSGLFARIVHLDPSRAQTIDKFNRRRLIRALEIVMVSGKPVPPLSVIPSAAEGSLNLNTTNKGPLTRFGMTHYNCLWLGIKVPQKTLYKKIDLRLKQRFKQGMIKEVNKLHTSGISWKRLESFGLEYKYISQFLQKYPNYSLPLTGRVREGWQQMFTQLSYAIKHYSKRQLTWWKRNKEIIWIKPDIKKAISLTKKFLSI